MGHLVRMQTKVIRSYCRDFGTRKYPPNSGKSSQSWSKSRSAPGRFSYSFSFKVKWGYISTQQLESEHSKSFPGIFFCFEKVLLCQFHCKPKPSGISLETQGVENIAQIPANLAEVCQNHHGRKAVLSNLSVLKWSGAIFRPRSSKVSVQKVFPC